MNLLIVCGGQSAEHDISLRSALTVVSHIHNMDVCVCVIDKYGVWRFLPQLSDLQSLVENKKDVKDCGAAQLYRSEHGVIFSNDCRRKVIDVVFPICHGPFGEDGTMQGYLSLLQVPYVGCNHKSSLLAMDKEIFKRLMDAADMPQLPWVCLRRGEFISWSEMQQLWDAPVFVKPANMGSSIGISRVTCADDWQPALDHAFQYDDKVVLEKAIDAIDIECGVRGRSKLTTSAIGQITTDSWYDYDEKYAKGSTANITLPARVPDTIVKEVQKMSLKACELIECRDMARVDFLYQSNGDIYINEINTIPGFTSISLYPKMWECSGVPIKDLIKQMIDDAMRELQEA